MTTAPCLISPYVQAFFVDHLQQHKRLSPQTIASCRDTFRLLLNFMKQTRGIEPSSRTREIRGGMCYHLKA
jgi:hypothetical protein